MARTIGSRVFTGIIAIMMAFVFMPAFGQDAYAATVRPGEVTINKVSVDGSAVMLKWSKAKNAKKYRVFVQTGADGWKYWKSVRVTKKNKKKYSDRLKYKLKKSGKKYKVYKKENPYRLVKITTARKYTYTGEYSTVYRFAIQAMNGKEAGKYSAAKSVKTKAKAKAPETPQPSQQTDPTKPTDPTTATDPTTPSPTVIPGKVSNLKATHSVVSGDCKITLTWTAASDATSYDVYRQKNGGSWQGPKNKTECKYVLGSVTEGATYKFKVVAKNDNGEGEPVEITTTVPTKDPSGSSSVTTWDKYLNKMLGYYKQELQTNYGVDINSTNKADEFKKLHAIMAVMQKYVGYSERLDSSSPTGYTNWFYNDNNAACNGTDTSGAYYNGKDYIPTIEFYAACDAIAETQEYLAHQAGLDAYRLGKRGTSHMYVIICANNMWYNADPAFYMAPGVNGLEYGYNITLHDVSKFKEYKGISFSLSKGTSPRPVENVFKLGTVFCGSSASVDSTGGLSFINGSGGIGIGPEDATYTSSDESILSFDNNNGTCTIHKTGTVYVTITYQNVKPGGQVPSITTTIAVQVVD